MKRKESAGEITNQSTEEQKVGLLGWIREKLAEYKNGPEEHLESCSRISHQVFAVSAELEYCGKPLALAYLQAAKCFRTLADALLGEGFPDSAGGSRGGPAIMHELADEWYGKIPELLVAARQEAAFSYSAAYPLPVLLWTPESEAASIPESYLAGLRRAASAMDELVANEAELARLDADLFRTTILLYEAARTHKELGDALTGSLIEREISEETIKDAAAHYWKALPNYMLVAQGLKAPQILNQYSLISFQKCKLDSKEVWRVTAPAVIEHFKENGSWESEIEKLRAFWEDRPIKQEEREYECAVEQLLSSGQIAVNGRWYKIPYPYTYRVEHGPVTLFNKDIPVGHKFVYDYGKKGEFNDFITMKEFRRE